jgi:hypothetical protein
MHVHGADLDLQRDALRTHHRRVQRLIHVRLGHRDVVLETAGDGLPESVDGAERPVAVAERGNEDAEADEVVDLVELLAADHHLFVDRVQVLRPPLHIRFHAELLQLRPEGFFHLFEELLPLAPAGLDEVRDLAVRTGVQGLEREILELPLQLLDAQAIGEGGVDLEGLVGDLVLARFRERREGSHVVEPIGELDEEDPDVAGHRHDHLPDILCLRQLTAPELQLVQLRQAVDDPGDLVAELLLDVPEADIRVLDRVVQERRGEGRGVEPEIREDRGHGDGVLDVGLAREAVLALVRILGEPVRTFQQLRVGLRVVRANLLQDRGEEVRGAGVRASQSGARDPGESPAALGRVRLGLPIDPHVTPGGVHVPSYREV